MRCRHALSQPCTWILYEPGKEVCISMQTHHCTPAMLICCSILQQAQTHTADVEMQGCLKPRTHETLTCSLPILHTAVECAPCFRSCPCPPVHSPLSCCSTCAGSLACHSGRREWPQAQQTGTAILVWSAQWSPATHTHTKQAPLAIGSKSRDCCKLHKWRVSIWQTLTAKEQYRITPDRPWCLQDIEQGILRRPSDCWSSRAVAVGP